MGQKKISNLHIVTDIKPSQHLKKVVMLNKSYLHFLSTTLFVLTTATTVLEDVEVDVVEKPDACYYYAHEGDLVEIEYIGVLHNGSPFVLKAGKSPLKFTLGAGSVIKGLERGLKGMCVDEQRALIVPPHLGYGTAGIKGSIPPDSPLIIHVTMLNLDRETSREKEEFPWDEL